MRTYRSLFLVFLTGTYVACLAEEEASIPPAVATDAAEGEVLANLAEAQLAAASAAAAAQEEAPSLWEREREEKEDAQEEDGSEEEVDSDDHVVEVVAAIEDDAEAALEAAEAADATTGAAAAGVADIDVEDDEPADPALAASTGRIAGAADIDVEDDEPADPALAASTGRILGVEHEGDSEKKAGTWRRAVGLQVERAAGRVDGFIDGWRSKRGGNSSKRALGSWRSKEGGNLFKGALASYDTVLKEHYIKMSFGQATALGVLADTIAQQLEKRRNPGQRYEFKRTLHAGVLNMIIDGVFTPQWYILVDYINDEMTLALAFAKALAASVFYAPFANGLFLAGARVLRYGLKTRFGWAEWRRQLTVCTVRDFEMWPPLHILNFWLMPKHWRPLAGHLAGVVLLAVISSTGLTDAGLPLGQRAVPLMMRWASGVGKWIGGKGRRAAGAPPAESGRRD